MLLDGLDAEAAQRRATDMMKRLGLVDWRRLAPDLDVTISIGVAAGQSNDPQPLLVQADEALYRSKRRAAVASRSPRRARHPDQASEQL